MLIQSLSSSVWPGKGGRFDKLYPNGLLKPVDNVSKGADIRQLL